MDLSLKMIMILIHKIDNIHVRYMVANMAALIFLAKATKAKETTMSPLHIGSTIMNRDLKKKISS